MSLTLWIENEFASGSKAWRHRVVINLPPDMKRLLDGSGFDWRIEEGARHRKVIVAGRVITILPKSNHELRNGTWRTHRNAMGHIKRALRDLEPYP